MTSLRQLVMTSLGSVLLVGLIACGDEETTDPGGLNCPGCATAASPDEAMGIFREVYSGRILDCYRDLLDTEFRFIDQDGGIDTYDDEIRIANKMFNGLEGGTSVIISDIVIDQLVPQGEWIPTPADDEHFGVFTDSQTRQYVVDFKFAVSGQNLILRVQGPVLFYVRDVGDGSPEFELLGLIDATYGNKTTNANTWTDVRALFD